MGKAKFEKKQADKKANEQGFKEELFNEKDDSINEIESDGSASAFEETERVYEDNFDDLSEK
jgi:hypothetical protein